MHKYLLITFIILLTGGCNSFTTPPTLTSPSIKTLTKVSPSPTTTPTLTHTQTVTPIITPTATITHTPSITLTPTITPTATMTLAPTATFSPPKKNEFVLDLIRNNGGCELPCLWGITPGTSTERDYFNQLEPINDFIIFTNYLSFSRYVYIDPVVENHKIEILVYSVYILNIDKNGSVNGINWQVYNAMEPFSVNNVLSHYGIPDRVLLGARIGN